MKNLSWIIVLLLLICTPLSGASASTNQNDSQNNAQNDKGMTVAQLTDVSETDGVEDMAFTMQEVSDPIEPVNRAMLQVNDIVYFGVLRPVAYIYGAIIPEQFRSGIRNFFHNLATPQYVVSSLLQGDAEQAGVELSRFGINTVLGVGGLFEVAEKFDLKSADEDIGQALGKWGAGDDMYVVWPIIGPSNARDTIGKVGDTLLNPMTYALTDFWTLTGGKATETTNETSFHIGEYEDFNSAALDPYVALRNAYLQRRSAQIEK